MRKIIFIQAFVLMALLFFGFGCSSKMAGEVQLGFGNYGAAIQNFEKAVSENPDDGEARKLLGIAYYKNGQAEPAALELTRALEILPDDPDARYYLGLAELRRGNGESAARNWRRHHDPEHPRVQEAVNQQLTLLEISQSIKLAKKAVADEESLQTQAPQPGSVAVFYYYDATPDQQFRYLQKALAAMIITDLSQVKSLTVVERLRVQYLLEEMALGRTDVIDPGTAPRTGRLLGAESLVIGTLASGSIQSETSVASTVKKDVIATFPAADEEENFFKLEKEIVSNLLGILKISPTQAEKQVIDKYHTTSYPAVICYGQALDAQDKGQWKDAREYYRCALTADPGFSLARQGLDHCPGENAPGIGELGEMDASGLAEMAETGIRSAQVRDHHEAEQEQRTGSTGDREEADAGDGRGDISVSW
ncbi:tetratricopeptide repeat protein [Desulfococcus sp.]|uniref:tetratricopeptide repeat protein n=1 Tax=Desulfococcus sp. TaxID=2025834 RepID=UPI0035948658